MRLRVVKFMDSDGSRMWISIAAAAVMLIAKSYYAACEHAIIEVNDTKVKSLAAGGSKPHQRLYELISTPGKVLYMLSAQRTFLGVMISVALMRAFFAPLSDGIHRAFTFAPDWIDSIVTFLIISMLTAILIVTFSEILPRRIVDKIDCEDMALRAVTPVRILIALLYPFSLLSRAFSYLICKLFGLSTSSKKDIVTEEEILMMVEAGNETGVIEESQREMINNIFEFGDAAVSEVMTHRKDIVAVDKTAKISEIVSLAINEGFSRIPVYEKTVDSIIGIIYVKDLLALIGNDNPELFVTDDFLREAMYVPETAKCDSVLEEMSKKKSQIAIVIDEYGGTAGMITMEDLIEEIVGNIQDEYDNDEAEISEISEGVYTIDGSADPEDILPKLNLPIPSEHSYDTMSAMVVDLLGHIPSEDEAPSVMYKNIEFKVLLTEDNWISKIKAIRLDSNVEAK